MTSIDYLLLTGAVLAGGYVVARLFIGWFRSSANHAGIQPDEGLNPPLIPEPVKKTTPPWHLRK
jgi:hypothetical protein